MAINGLLSVSDDRISKRQRPLRQKGVIISLVGQDCDVKMSNVTYFLKVIKKYERGNAVWGGWAIFEQDNLMRNIVENEHVCHSN
jgi:hypothetical protein